ncbi:homocysteine S-methyltransferase [Actinomyces gaoshouyii]|uniref:Homocysteine S-methyltransferase n=1 Tax=Actinomyces gaoshouyii TaxID=1960083 RepID=A0A8H9HC06_9ACTO|nr:homocysteine S-methyltransferase [Actinomyces gaoshouyii]GGO99307.1 homocysteine S-methyltransferase [Actinomyces gaoshouyii]
MEATSTRPSSPGRSAAGSAHDNADVSPLARALREGPLVLDGAMGTELDARGIPTAQELWSALALVTAPEAVAAVHESYLRAGARVITTNSYQAALPALMRSGLSEPEARGAIASSARIALETAERFSQERPDRAALVAGSLGPYGAYLADGSEYTGAYALQAPDFEAVHIPRIEALAGEGIRLFAVETQPRLDEAQWIVRQLGRIAPGSECWVSFQTEDDGERLADGTPLAEVGAWADVEPGVAAVGINCVAPSAVTPALGVLGSVTAKPLVAYPNSGDIYHPSTKTWTSAAPDQRFTAQAPDWGEAGARLIGGCCRTTPADTAVLRGLVDAR